MRRTRAVFDLSALRHNLRRVRAVAPDSRILAAIKADGYGHGLLQVAEALAGADGFGVACLEEAQQLRRAGIDTPILLLEGVHHTDEAALLAPLKLDAVIHALSQLDLLSGAAVAGRVGVWLKIDSGMHRLGLPPAQFAEALERVEAMPHLTLRGAMTHFAAADERGGETTPAQLALFDQVIGGRSLARSSANSAGLLAWPQARTEWVRPGIMLYGVSPFADRVGTDEGLRPVMSLHSELIAINPLKRGDRIGYGGGWECPEDTAVGVVAVGYGDGYPRHAANGTPVLVNGREVAMVGRVSMDMITVDLRSQPGAQVGDPVVLWGEGLAVERIAASAGTIAYELLCGLTQRVVREYRTGE